VVDASSRSKIERSYGPIPYDRNEIADFLAKPVRLGGGELLLTDTVNMVKYTASISSLLNTYQIWYRKIAGYGLIRATFNIKVVINANPFQQGRVILNFIPGWRHLNTAEQAAYNLNLGQITTSPNVELDIQDTSAEMSIPYISPFSYFDRTQNVYDWGTFWFRIMSPLKTGSGGPSSCEYAIFGHWSDVELAAPIYGPEMDLQKPRRTVRKLLHSNEEKDTNSQGWLESASHKVVAASKVLSGYGVPFADIVGSAGSAVASVASLFGWSKPLNLSNPTYVISHPTRGLNVYDAANNADSLGLSISPMLSPRQELFGSDIDEMSWDYLKSIPAFYTRFTFPSTAVFDQVLLDFNTRPDLMLQVGQKVVGASNLQYATGAPAFWLSRFFDLYRGGIKITFKFVKTQYHSGRISITFVPNDSLGVTFDQSVYVLREIVDLRTSSEVTLELPFIRGENYLDTNVASGRLQICVLNELRAPETASQEIDVLVYVSGAADFELACPSSKVNARHFTPEMDRQQVTMVNKGIGDSKCETMNFDHNSLSISDPFVSLKQLLNCSRRIYSADATLSSQSGVISPFALGVSRYTVSGSSFTEPDAFNLDFLSLFSHGYSFFRGGIRLTRAFNAGTVAGFVGSFKLLSSTVAGSLATFSIPTTTNGALVGNRYTTNQLNLYTDRAMDVNVPYWNNTPISYVRYLSNSTSYPTDQATPNNKLFYSFTNATAEVYRSGADDYCLGYFRGFMPVVISVIP